MIKFSNESLTLYTALYALFGQRPGKLFTKNVKTGETNFPSSTKHPFTNEPLTSCYLSTEDWSKRFGDISNAYEECRASAVALYMMNFDDPFETFFSKQ